MTVSKRIREHVEQKSGHRCGYCQIHARYVHAPMEIDHITPISDGGTDDEDNLYLACPRCNNSKSNQTHETDPDTGQLVRLFNPQVQGWAEHFRWSDDGTQIVGQTPCGRATVIALNMNTPHAVEFRRLLVSAGWYPPKG